MDNEKIYYIKLELIIAKIYLFLLPIRMINIFSIFTIYLKDIAKYFDFLICVLGLILIIIRTAITKKATNGSKKEKLFNLFVFMITVFNISSLLMAFIIDSKYGTYAGESSYSAVIKMALIFIQYITMIFYNKEIFKLLGIDKIKKILSKTMVFLLIIGYIQLLILIGGGGIENLYNKLDIFDIFVDNISAMKMPLTESEGALSGGLISIFILPFLASNMMMEKNSKKYLFQIIAWIPIIIASGSLTEYLLCMTFFITFGFYFIKMKGIKKKLYLVLIIPIVVFGIFTIFFKKLPVNIQQNIIYTINNKLFDSNNGSTVSRTVIPIKYNMGAFMEYPILGVGNGNQGYFYYNYVDYKYSLVPGIRKSYENAGNTIYNGGLFFPSIVSGYGVLGVLLLIIYILESEKEVNKNKKDLDIFYLYYKMARIPFFLAGFQTLFVGTYYIWFVLSIPHFRQINNN